jgi:NADH-quinone oxidoreductase subunit A
MDGFLLQYLPILIFIGIAAVVGIALLAIPMVVAPSKPDP